jgi:hypothetical protein
VHIAAKAINMKTPFPDQKEKRKTNGGSHVGATAAQFREERWIELRSRKVNGI